MPAALETCPLPNANPTASFWHCQPSPLLMGHRSTRDLPETAGVVVIGSGITGASVAHYLLDENDRVDKGSGKMSRKDVVMLEAREVCWGATGRNGGHCYPIYFDHPHDPSIGRFELANFNTIRDLVTSRSIDCEFNVQPGIRAIYSPSVFASVKSAIEVLRSTAPDLAAELQVFDGIDDLARLRVPKAAGAVVSATAARMWPYKFVARILEDLLTPPREGGGSFNLQTHTPVTSLAPLTPDKGGEARWVVQTPRGSVRARTVVLATN
ncbi:hypothetical protein LTR66_016508, partial [Elasticomyces elasticus]